MRVLNNHEIQEVSGGVGPGGAIFGGVTGGAGYLANSATSGEFSWTDFAIATGTGAATGFVGGKPASAAARYLIPRITAGGGAVQGAN